MASKKLPAQYIVAPDCDVLPLIQLAQWAAHAGAALSEIRDMEDMRPDFDKAMRTYLPDLTYPENFNPCKLVSEVLWVAERLLKTHLDVEG